MSNGKLAKGASYKKIYIITYKDKMPKKYILLYNTYICSKILKKQMGMINTKSKTVVPLRKNQEKEH